MSLADMDKSQEGGGRDKHRVLRGPTSGRDSQKALEKENILSEGAAPTQCCVMCEGVWQAVVVTLLTRIVLEKQKGDV